MFYTEAFTYFFAGKKRQQKHTFQETSSTNKLADLMERKLQAKIDFNHKFLSLVERFVQAHEKIADSLCQEL